VSKGGRRRGHLVFLALALALVALWNLGPIADTDVWWHLRSGEMILDDGLPRLDPFSWTAAGADWQLNAWLGDVLFALARRAGGLAALGVLQTLAVVATGAGTYALARRWGARPWPAATVTSLAMVLIGPFIVLRPLLAGLALFPFVLLLADSALTGSRRALLVLAALIVLWANLHASFTVGVGVIGLMALGAAVDRRTARRPLTVAVTAFAAGLATPYGLAGYLHALTVRSASQRIEEWQPLSLSDPRGLLLAAFAVLMAVAVVLTPPASDATRRSPWKPLFWTVIPVLAALAVLTFTAIRSGAFLLIVGTAPIAISAGALGLPRLRRWMAERTAPILLGLLVAWVVVVVPLLPVLTRSGEIDEALPVAAVDAIPPNCALLNEYEYGGLIVERRWPEVLVSQDGRNDLYGLELLADQESILGASSLPAVDAFGADCILLRSDRPLVPLLEADTGWDRVASDGDAVLFVRAG